MRMYYGALYQTPYLYSSTALERYFNHAKDDDEVKAIQHHMQRHEVYDDPSYEGFMKVTKLIQKDQFEEYETDWDSLEEMFKPFVQYDGTIRLRPNRHIGKNALIESEEF
ncbi:hypothetical protein [Bacillus sp. AFS041924]|uniref:hypothetical protein n=1 Tax=Bacillus sp. AFS041924 TaxID=2033503 RepID=UPI000BFC5C40|nr:hypothetical protein [Bacillus sp. AFS041924]PGS55112.1 hypothetical protein COC46_04090 [Bacillus sp. AFS041924]